MENLSKDEISKMNDLISEYHKAYFDIVYYSKEIDDLEKKKKEISEKVQNLITRLESLRFEEENYRSELQKKYGEFIFDPKNYTIKSPK